MRFMVRRVGSLRGRLLSLVAIKYLSRKYRAKVFMTAIILVLSNVLLGVGVLVFGWNIHHLLFAYWLEIIIIGLFNLAKIVVVCIVGNPWGARIGSDSRFGNLFMSFVAIVFFATKFGGVIIATFFLLLILPSAFVEPEVAKASGFIWKSLREMLSGVSYYIPILLISHGVSFLINFIGRKEFKKDTVIWLIVYPYVRCLTMMIVVIPSVLISQLYPVFGLTSTFALVLVVFKLVGDLLTHLRIHSN